MTEPLVQLLGLYMPDITPEKIVCLNWEVEGTASELPLLWLALICLSYVWDRRKHSKTVSFRECRAEIIGHMNLVNRSRFQNDKTVLSEIIKNHFGDIQG